MAGFVNSSAIAGRVALMALAGLLFVGPLAQIKAQTLVQPRQIGGNGGLLDEDGRLIPDFDRETDAEQPAPDQLPQPRDPLDQSYRDQSSAAIDRREGDRVRAPLRDPLRELPRDFRDDAFLMQLVREANRAGDRNWRARDDGAFDPAGIAAGGFVFYPEVYSGLIASNNLFATRKGEKSDYGTQITPRFRVRSDWNNHELELFGTLTRTDWRRFSSESTTEFETRVRGRLDVTSRTSLEGGLRHERQMEGRGSRELPDAASRPAVTGETEIFAQLNHRFNRLGFRLRGQVIRNRYENVRLNNGAIQNNAVRNYDERLLSLRTNYEFSPRFSLFADTALGERVFDTRLDAGGLLQGSESWMAMLGTRIEFSPSLAFMGQVGFAQARPDEASLVDLEGVVYEARLVWSPTRLVTLTMTGASEMEETSESGSPGSLNRSLSLEMVNSWTHRFSSTLRGEYEVRDHAGISRIDRELTLGLDIEYLFSPSLALEAGYEHTLVEGAGAYREDELRLGLRWRR